MYIQFCDFYKTLKLYDKHKAKFKKKGDKAFMFYCLFASYTENNDVQQYKISRMTCNYCPVIPEIRDYYRDTGIETLARDILENVFPELTSAQAFADTLCRMIRGDPDLMAILKSKGVRRIQEEEGMELAVYIANVLDAIINRHHFPSTKDTEPEFPECICPRVTFQLISRSVPKPTEYFIGRNKELEKLHDLLCSSHDAVVWGLPGIGKSDLVCRYCEVHRDDYNSIIYVNYNGNLAEDICTLQIFGASPNTGDMFRDMMFCLRHLQEDTLLVIDNMNTLGQQEADSVILRQCGCKVLVTTQRNAKELNIQNHLELEEIKDMRSLIALVKSISGNKNLNEKTLKTIINIMHRHTTAVVLLGILLRKDQHTTGEILRALNMRRLKDFFIDKMFFSNREDNFRGHLRTLFRLFRYKGAEREVLENMVLMPKNGIPPKLLGTLMEWKDMDIMNGLAVQGMIQGERVSDAEGSRYLVSLKPMIRELAYEEFSPSIKSCSTLIRNCASAMDLLMDSNDDEYLLQVAKEVVEWAEKDDIPAYIDYLHKSFELAHRHYDTLFMQKIADKLAYLVVETPYGTNIDKALMQDYQATLQKDPKRAIEYRESAFFLLDMNQLKEKQLGAMLLERISGDYTEMYEWSMAKKYSDASWIMFREMDMLEKPETFSAACRRGVILCYVGDVEEGLGMLYKLERFIQKNEAYPTQNRVFLQTALSDAYQAAGDMEKSKKYEMEAKKSFDSLAKRMKKQD